MLDQIVDMINKAGLVPRDVKDMVSVTKMIDDDGSIWNKYWDELKNLEMLSKNDGNFPNKP